MNLTGLATVLEMDFCRRRAPWLAIALMEQGVKEVGGLDDNNPRVLAYLASFSYLAKVDHLIKNPADPKGAMIKSDYKANEVDETAWCACFVNWCLRQSYQDTSGMNAGAQGWKRFGRSLSQPRVGAIATVFKEPNKKTASMTTTGWHVAFYLGGPPESPTLLGGNQHNMVCTKAFYGYQIHYRWPSTFLAPKSHSRFA